MKFFKTHFFLLFIIIQILSSCTVEPKEINYGQDHCALCDMTVVDKTHAAQYVTKKGKAYMFDAVECLTRKINKENNEEQLAYILVADYNNPGKLVAAKDAYYLISEKIKSPMGANLSAFANKEQAQNAQKEFGEEVFSWNDLKQKLR